MQQDFFLPYLDFLSVAIASFSWLSVRVSTSFGYLDKLSEKFWYFLCILIKSGIKLFYVKAT